MNLPSAQSNGMNDEAEKWENDKEIYRRDLLECDKKSIEEYDKAIIALSGGAIGISFAFIKDICDFDHLIDPCLLSSARALLGFSILSVLVSHYCSHRAMRRALVDLNNDKLNYDKPGRGWDTAINILNPIGGALFLFGLIFLLLFASLNFGRQSKDDVKPTEAHYQQRS